MIHQSSSNDKRCRRIQEEAGINREWNAIRFWCLSSCVGKRQDLRSHQRLPFVVSSQMPSNMFGQMIAPHESPATQRTSKLLLSRMSSLVSGQFIRTRELSPTSIPNTSKRLLSCFQRKEWLMRLFHYFVHRSLQITSLTSMWSVVCLQMRALVVSLSASCEVTLIRSLSLCCSHSLLGRGR